MVRKTFKSLVVMQTLIPANRQVLSQSNPVWMHHFITAYGRSCASPQFYKHDTLAIWLEEYDRMTRPFELKWHKGVSDPCFSLAKENRAIERGEQKALW